MPMTPGKPIAANAPVFVGGDIFDRISSFNPILLDPVRAVDPEANPMVHPDEFGPWGP